VRGRLVYAVIGDDRFGFWLPVRSGMGAATFRGVVDGGRGGVVIRVVVDGY
jgi:hypothetical protein